MTVVPQLSSSLPFGSASLTGDLFLYGQGRAVFESPAASSTSSRTNKKCILLGGLSDGLWPVPYTAALEKACTEAGYSLVQPILSSSYTGFGHGSLARDTEEMDELLQCLVTQRDAASFALVGHSTGCQDIVYYLKHSRCAAADPTLLERIKVVALQAPVSDREHAMTEPGYEENLATACRMKDAGKEDEMMPRSAFWAPITASRFLALQEKGGEDDFFSSDYTDAELAERLGHIAGCAGLKHALVAFSGMDEYVPKSVDKKGLLERLVKAMNGGEGVSSSSTTIAEGLYLPDANHNLQEGPTAYLDFIKRFQAILEQT